MMKKDDWLWEIAKDCLEDMYQAAVPSMSFKELLQKVENKEDYDKSYFQHHYLPEELHKSIIDSYKHVYNLEDYFQEYTDILKEYLLDGGKTEITTEDPDSFTGKSRKIVDTPKLSDVIGEENAEKVKDLIEKCQHFYRIDEHRNRGFEFTIFNYSPNCNKESVEKYWKEQGKEYDFDDEKIIEKYYGE